LLFSIAPAARNFVIFLCSQIGDSDAYAGAVSAKETATMNAERRYSEDECNYSVKIGMAGGFIVGWAIGIALILYLNSPALNQWDWVLSIPFWNAIGWMLYGMIGGSGGIFADFRFHAKVERQLDRALHLSERPAA
jgi:hypothetical protein